MPVIQTFDTFLADTTTSGSLLVRTIPQSVLPEEYSGPNGDYRGIAEALDVEIITDFRFAGSGLPKIIASMLAAPELYGEVGRERFERWWRSVLDTNPDLVSFAETVAYRPLIPTQMSPLELKSLADIATGSAVLLGLLHGGPVLIVSGLVGIVLVRVVNGLAEGAEQAFKEATYEWVGKLLHIGRRH